MTNKTKDVQAHTPMRDIIKKNGHTNQHVPSGLRIWRRGDVPCFEDDG